MHKTSFNNLIIIFSYRPPARDFSIDSVTDAVFNEFLRYDPKLELRSQRSQSTNQNSFFKSGSATPPRRLDPVNETVPRAPPLSSPRSHRKDSIENHHHTPLPTKLSPQLKDEVSCTFPSDKTTSAQHKIV